MNLDGSLGSSVCFVCVKETQNKAWDQRVIWGWDTSTIIYVFIKYGRKDQKNVIEKLLFFFGIRFFKIEIYLQINIINLLLNYINFFLIKFKNLNIFTRKFVGWVKVYKLLFISFLYILKNVSGTYFKVHIKCSFVFFF